MLQMKCCIEERFACLACHKDSHGDEKNAEAGGRNIAAIICRYCGVEQEVAKKCVNCHTELAKVSLIIHYKNTTLKKFFSDLIFRGKIW